MTTRNEVASKPMNSLIVPFNLCKFMAYNESTSASSKSGLKWVFLLVNKLLQHPQILLKKANIIRFLAYLGYFPEVISIFASGWSMTISFQFALHSSQPELKRIHYNFLLVVCLFFGFRRGPSNLWSRVGTGTKPKAKLMITWAKND